MTIALGTPIFTPYPEMTHLEDYDAQRRRISRRRRRTASSLPDAELKKLENPEVKAFFVVNPGNPTGMGISKEVIGKIANLIKTKRPDLMLLTDDVYGTFVNDFRSLLGEIPQQHNRCLFIFEIFRGSHRLAAWNDLYPRRQHLRQDDREASRGRPEKALDKRYGPLTLEPRKIRFIDRIVADSRDVRSTTPPACRCPSR